MAGARSGLQYRQRAAAAVRWQWWQRATSSWPSTSSPSSAGYVVAVSSLLVASCWTGPGLLTTVLTRSLPPLRRVSRRFLRGSSARRRGRSSSPSARRAGSKVRQATRPNATKQPTRRSSLIHDHQRNARRAQDQAAARDGPAPAGPTGHAQAAAASANPRHAWLLHLRRQPEEVGGARQRELLGHLGADRAGALLSRGRGLARKSSGHREWEWE